MDPGEQVLSPDLASSIYYDIRQASQLTLASVSWPAK